MTESWNVESAIPAQLKEQIKFLRNSPTLNAKSDNPIVNLFAFLHIVRQLKITRRTGWVDFDVANPGMQLPNPIDDFASSSSH